MKEAYCHSNIFDDKLGKDNSTAIVVSPLISLMVDQVKVSGVGL